LAFQETFRLAEITEADGAVVDGTQFGQGFGHRQSHLEPHGRVAGMQRG
jgi:hypothetical protein